MKVAKHLEVFPPAAWVALGKEVEFLRLVKGGLRRSGVAEGSASGSMLCRPSKKILNLKFSISQNNNKIRS